MQFSQATVVAFLAATAVAGKAPKKATENCEKVRSDCQSQPDANQAVCAAKYAACAGTTSGLNKPTASSNVTWVTTTVSNYVTYCPESTTFEVGKHTYTATESQWVTVTDCPKQECTITWQPTASPTVCPGTVVPRWNGTVVSPTAAPAPAGNGTYNKPTPGSNTGSGSNSGNTGSNSGNTGSSSGNTGSNSGNTGSSSGSENTPAEFTGAATKLAGSSAALTVVFGAVAYFL